MPAIDRQLVIRADASATVGGGHVQRCLGLADALRRRGWRCALLGEARTVPLPDWLEVLAAPREADLLIVDHYGLSAEWERASRAWARRILVIDDLADRAHDCDLLLDQGAGRMTEDYGGLVPSACHLLLGPDYALLRPDFARLRPEALARRNRPGRRIFINFGAADPNNIAGTLLRDLARRAQPFDADLVCGASDEHVPALRALAATLPGDVTIHGRVDEMAALMAQADLAIGAGGGASWERCVLGLPSVILTLADNQRYNAATLAEAGAAVVAQPETAADQALALLDDPARLAGLAERAAALCDGQGVERVALSIDQIVNRGPS